MKLMHLFVLVKMQEKSKFVFVALGAIHPFRLSTTLG